MSTLEIVLIVVSGVVSLLLAVCRGKIKTLFEAVAFLAKLIESQRDGALPLEETCGNADGVMRKREAAQVGADILVEAVQEKVKDQPVAVQAAVELAAAMADKKKDVSRGRKFANALGRIAFGIVTRNL